MTVDLIGYLQVLENLESSGIFTIFFLMREKMEFGVDQKKLL